MKNNKKLLILTVFTSLLLTGCNTTINFGYYDNLNNEQVYNKNLFYQNDLNTTIADPEIIYVDKEQDEVNGGYYYMYGTSDELGASGFYVWRSNNLNDWDIAATAFIPARDSWALTSLWAPEVHYLNGLYYLYYSGANYQSGTRKMGISVATSTSPMGPFKEFRGENKLGQYFTHRDQVFDFGYTAIDATIFKDGEDLYMYIASDQINGESSIVGYKLLDPVTLDLSTKKTLARPGKKTPTQDTDDINWEIVSSGGRWNEAPFMIKNNGVYYLTYSANPFWTTAYGVGYATSDGPLGDFVKPTNYINENLLLGLDPIDQISSWNFMSGTGHHCFFNVGEDIMIGYHAHIDREFGNSKRAFALDYINFKDNTIRANGPTWSLQPLPSAISGYKNVSTNASITVNNKSNKLLNDEVFPMHVNNDKYYELEQEFISGKNEIVITFNKEINARAIMIYNSFDYELAIFNIDNINFGTSSIDNLGFNNKYYDEFDEYIRPGCAFVAEFN